MEEYSPQSPRKEKKIKKGQRPMVVSNRKPFNIFEKKKTAKPIVRDPRFSNLSGTLNPTFFKKAYKFLFDKRQEEKGIIEQKLKGKKLTQEERQELKKKLSTYKDTERMLQRKEEERKLKQELVTQEKENILRKNKQPFYYSQRRIRKMVNEQMANKGSIKKAVKKEKKVVQRERKRNMIPERRLVADNV
ncbi:hypothetical protein C922_04877 [Plasmodium inui San Antonio 1]|uniref:rRNA biogenesis protein RRP36 n=1 Tax=Plasmodium inui San Antonio 1 TaxID=1237626 RepID=W6ZZN7_9APIC|nr:hypothetical protein C922_04877 [Plasmodium inui San Antonio 1]EUD64733.1 hypothetical protein C922_04877 [Plasmodium inui San Antonio 1]